jgi:SAM-dependent methyltransferase
MDASLRRAWTEIITGDDLDRHLAAVGQAQAGAELAGLMLHAAAPPAGARVVIAGAGTGQMLDFIDPATWRPFRLTFADLNPVFLARVVERLKQHGLSATILEDDIERTAIEPAPDLLMVTLVLEHIDWRRGVESIAALGPAACGIVIQENPTGIPIVPSRGFPPSLAEAFATAHFTLVPRQDLIATFAARGYACQDTWTRDVADGKKLIGLLFARR